MAGELGAARLSPDNGSSLGGEVSDPRTLDTQHLAPAAAMLVPQSDPEAGHLTSDKKAFLPAEPKGLTSAWNLRALC